MRLVPVILETHNQTNNEWLPKFVQTDNASSKKQKECPLVSNFRMDPLPGRIIVEVNKTLSKFLLMDIYSGNVVPRVFRLFSQRGNAGKTLGHRKNSNFLIGCSVTVSIVLPLYKDGHKTHYPSGRTIFCCVSFKTDNGRCIMKHNA